MLNLRAKLILACAAGAPNNEVARRLDVTNATVGKWRRFIERRINGLYDELRPGKPRTIDDVAALINKTLPKWGAPLHQHWVVTMAREKRAM